MEWRTFSRKIIVIATDGFLHFAGDGILAGITKKNPGICLIGEDGSYTGALEYDYPSLEEIYRKLVEYKVPTITKNQSFLIVTLVINNFRLIYYLPQNEQSFHIMSNLKGPFRKYRLLENWRKNLKIYSSL